jgi:hypothetical protein
MVLVDVFVSSDALLSGALRMDAPALNLRNETNPI